MIVCLAFYWLFGGQINSTFFALSLKELAPYWGWREDKLTKQPVNKSRQAVRNIEDNSAAGERGVLLIGSC